MYDSESMNKKRKNRLDFIKILQLCASKCIIKKVNRRESVKSIYPIAFKDKQFN